MTVLDLLLIAAAAASSPRAIVVSTPDGERIITVRFDPTAGPLLPAAPLLSVLKGTSASDGVWVVVHLGGEPFRFLLGASLFVRGSRLVPLAGPALARDDTLFLPLQFVSEALPRLEGGRFSWDRSAARLIDRGPAPVVASRPPARASVPVPDRGLRRGHRVTIDPGHGGVDPGNPGMFFPSGLKEKDVVLAIGLLLRDELAERSVAVTMTRTRDTLIDLRQRGRYCTDECDLFVSLHVNALPRRSGFTAVRGFETYFLAEARTEDAARVARMENEALRFDRPSEKEVGGGLDFILRDLQLNEYLRESARAAALVQSHLAPVHNGENRGVRQAGLMVLTTARRPAILVELGFSTNREDARLLTTKSAQRRLAAALAEAIVAYLEEYERRSDGESVGGPR